ncbi:hypothetical protein M409DRAFT_66115 [Zasmidium cellare ATCC 36951]|uniref:FAD/NAD(P)-binding domain-containing protein n=1 Tax=Zasmidium cellare ATCC 36951 TaxID=1080233 RepID=A0A6A6CK76_ZASCE|nr:uncharacterized protein M409DRAFT_66115 [Zasmidium cellare ATCC 36951]KAF2167003.1 hypothetical protein M409DRAFT_66115 [Zasmidium cellare ATCC 36951]
MADPDSASSRTPLPRVTCPGRFDERSLSLDALIIGAGFAGVYLLHRLRQEGFNAKIVEAGTGLGGIWHWNNYPGARVDSQYPVYQLSIPEVFNTFEWTEHYPGSQELQRYFQHADKVLNLSNDVLYNTRVDAVRWDDTLHKWHVECENGTRITTRYLNCCMGFAAKRHFPAWPGLEDFEGYICHSSFWPAEGVDMKGKRVAVVGQGATGIQIAQESAKDAKELTVFIRTPNTALPMNQRKISEEDAATVNKTIAHRLQTERYGNAGGFLFGNPERKMLEDSPEERERLLGEFYQRGGFAPLFVYADILTDPVSNRFMYDYWAKRTRARISDPVKRDILAPLEPPHAFMGKRPSLEQDYYEQLDKDHVKLVDLRKVSVSHVVPQGIVTSDGELHKLDILAMATGFDSLTGSFTQVKIEGMNGIDLEQKWNTDLGALSYLGISVAQFPNLFYTYGPHAPTAYGNGPSIVEPQAEWIVKVMKQMNKQGKTKINAKESYEREWKKEVNDLHAATLRHNVDSWYMGTNIPGKPRQALNYAGGLSTYIATINERLNSNFEGFEVV